MCVADAWADGRKLLVSGACVPLDPSGSMLVSGESPRLVRLFMDGYIEPQ